MTTKDKLFLIKIWACHVGVVMFVMFCYYASQPNHMWDSALLLAADKTFWFGLLLFLAAWGTLTAIERHHNNK